VGLQHASHENAPPRYICLSGKADVRAWASFKQGRRAARVRCASYPCQVSAVRVTPAESPEPLRTCTRTIFEEGPTLDRDRRSYRRVSRMPCPYGRARALSLTRDHLCTGTAARVEEVVKQGTRSSRDTFGARPLLGMMPISRVGPKR